MRELASEGILQKLHGFHLSPSARPQRRAVDMYHRNPRDDLPDVRDGLTSRERIVLQCLHALQQDRGGRHVPTGMLYGSVVEYVDMTVEEMQSILVRLVGHA